MKKKIFVQLFPQLMLQPTKRREYDTQKHFFGQYDGTYEITKASSQLKRQSKKGHIVNLEAEMRVDNIETREALGASAITEKIKKIQ